MTAARRSGAPGENWPSADDPRFPDRPIWINGEVRRGSDATVSLFDRGARDALALIETIRVEQREPQLWQRHMERLMLSAAELGFPVPPSAPRLAEAIGELLEAATLDDAAVRITVSRGVLGLRPGRPGCWIDAQPLDARLWRGTRSGDASAIVWDVPFAPGPFGKYKTANRLVYQHAADQARIAGADEALLKSADDELLEGANSNVFVVRGETLATPPLSTGILPGVMRAVTLDSARRDGMTVEERAIAVSELEDCTEAFVTNAIQQICPLRRIGSVTLPGGPVFGRVQRSVLSALTHRSG